MPTPTRPAPLQVREIDEATHREHLAARASASFLQTPGWGRVKSEWRRESIGFFDGESLVGVALVLYRQLPKVKRFLAYVPEGPVLDWAEVDLASALPALAAHVKARGAFGIRIGPPVVTARWSAQQVKDGIADDDVRRLGDLAPTERDTAGARVVTQLRELGWRPQVADGGFAAGQPQFVFQVPLRDADGTALDEDAVLKGMNQLWRRNIKKAAKLGVEVTASEGREEALARLEDFHALYVHTAERDHFTPRPLSYFRVMVEALATDGEAVGESDRIRLYEARHEGLLHRQARGPRLQRGPVADDARRTRGRRRRLRPPRHHRHPRLRGLPRRSHPVQGRHRRRGRRARRRVGPPAQPAALQGLRALHGAQVRTR